MIRAKESDLNFIFTLIYWAVVFMQMKQTT